MYENYKSLELDVGYPSILYKEKKIDNNTQLYFTLMCPLCKQHEHHWSTSDFLMIIPNIERSYCSECAVEIPIYPSVVNTGREENFLETVRQINIVLHTKLTELIKRKCNSIKIK